MLGYLPRRGRRSPFVLLTTVGLVAAACATLLTGHAGDGDLGGHSPGFTWDQTHRVDLPPGWTVAQRNVAASEESTSLSGPDGKGCLVQTWRSEPAADRWPRSPKKVTVHGAEGFYGRLDPDFGPYSQAVIWRELGQRWIGVSCDLDEAGVLGLAQGVRLARNPMHVPFRLSAVPKNLSLVAVIESYDREHHRAGAQFEVPDQPLRLSMQISNVPDPSYIRPDETVEHRGVGGRQVEIRAASQTICFPTRSQPICISGPGDEPATDWSPAARELALRTAELLSPVDDPDDDSSWLDADLAFPR